MSEIYKGNLEQFEKLIKSIPDLERKGKTMPYTSVNGHMFSFLDKEGQLSVRLPNNMLDQFIEEHKSSLSVQHGRVMKEYVVVPEKLLMDVTKLKPYFLASYEYTKSLKPKPTKKK